ncbi:winged helix-turn-helix domain-containing protein [Nonomuraea jiangxiensis]
MRRHGWSVQVTSRRAIERDEGAVRYIKRAD